MTTAYATDPSFTEHDFPRHPEHAGRIQAVWSALEAEGLTDQLFQLTPDAATDEQILAVHRVEHLQRLIDISHCDGMVMIDQDTYALPRSLDVSRLAAGAVIRAVDAVCAGDANNAMAIVRPPGHHATSERQMGFCLLNNIAIGARHALNKYPLNRVMILDYDVHHGNGTQDIFYSDPAVLFLSIHQSPHYPGTGHIDEIGTSVGRGATLNMPVSAGHGDTSYLSMFEQVVIPVTERFRPDLMLISVGFDAHWIDPLAGMRLSLDGYDRLARECLKLAESICAGRIVFVMEGGYDLKALSHGWCNIARVLLDLDGLSDPYGSAPGGSSADDIQPLLDRVRAIHGI